MRMQNAKKKKNNFAGVPTNQLGVLNQISTEFMKENYNFRNESNKVHDTLF